MYAIFKKSGLFQIEEGEEVEVTNLAYHLRSVVDIEDDVTIGDIISYLHRYENQSDLLFEPYTLGFNLKPLYEEMCKEVSEDVDTSFVDDIKFIELKHIMDLYEFEDDDCNTHSSLEEYIHVCGIGIDKTSYGIEFTPLYLLKDKCVKLNTEVSLRDPSDPKKNLFVSNKEFNVGDLFGSILHELTFHGGPEGRDSTWLSIKETDDMIDSGEMKTFTVDEMMLEFLEEDLERLVKDEKYEKASKVKKEIDEIRGRIEKEGE